MNDSEARQGDPPARIYLRGRDEASTDETRWSGRATLTSNARLACFIAILAAAWLAFGIHQISQVWVGLPIAAFVGLVVVHDRVLRQQARATRMRRFYEDGLARLEDRWAGRGDGGDRYLEPTHPYAADLDVFGPGSLFELLATTRTAPGSDRLASWLRNPAEPESIRRRQAAVRELALRLDLRLELALAGDEAGSSIQQEALEEWAAAPAAALPRPIFFLAITATTLSLLAIALWLFTGAGPLPFLLALALQGVLGLALRSRVRPVLAAAETPVQSLARTASLLACIESEHFDAPLLAELSGELETTGHPPSAELEALRRLVDRRDARANQFFLPIAALLMWGTHVALALEAWRARCGPRLPVWVATAGEIEALCALSGFAYEHPDDAFPEIVAAGDGPVFEGAALGHPLLPAATCVRNDLALSGPQVPSGHQALVMSGSNMSGKSTMLRTVGCNAILALAGAPVRAEQLRISPLRIAASIRIVDSLRDGQSHFMAEIVRLRQVVEISGGEPPALFLLDEILHGTNSHDRRIGAQAVIEGLLAQGALGIVTTHDLALTQMVPDSGGKLANVHFEDHLEEGAMKFDYALRKGIVEKSNALALMRSVGLDV
ncbi:MAG: DNA mismatch repair protein MutS [Deltaproteobacteria bacterium]|nr:DNA mismatch repair protein MutS [Deltaproteobacteria bacterium]